MFGMQMTAFDPSLELHSLVIQSNDSEIDDEERNEKFKYQAQLPQKFSHYACKQIKGERQACSLHAI